MDDLFCPICEKDEMEHDECDNPVCADCGYLVNCEHECCIEDIYE